MDKTPTLKLYRMADEISPDGLRVCYVVTLNSVPLMKSHELRPMTPWSPDDVVCPEDMNSLVLSIEKALGVYCGWADLRGTRKVTRFSLPGAPGFQMRNA